MGGRKGWKQSYPEQTTGAVHYGDPGAGSAGPGGSGFLGNAGIMQHAYISDWRSNSGKAVIKAWRPKKQEKGPSGLTRNVRTERRSFSDAKQAADWVEGKS